MNTSDLYSTKMYIYDFPSNLIDDAQKAHPFWLDVFETPIFFTIAVVLCAVTVGCLLLSTYLAKNDKFTALMHKARMPLAITTLCAFCVAITGATASFAYDLNSDERQAYIQSRMTEALPAVDGYMIMNFTNRDILCADNKPENHSSVFCGGTELKPVQYSFGKDSGTLTPFIETNPDTGVTSLGIDNKIDGVGYKNK